MPNFGPSIPAEQIREFLREVARAAVDRMLRENDSSEQIRRSRSDTGKSFTNENAAERTAAQCFRPHFSDPRAHENSTPNQTRAHAK